MRPVLFIFSLLLLSGCMVHPPLEITNTSAIGQQNGVLIGSISRKNVTPYYNEYVLYIRDSAKTTKKDIYVKKDDLIGNKFPDDFNDGETAGSVFAFVLPAGKYEMYNYFLFFSGMSTWRSKEDFSIQFEVKPGKVTYIGEYKMIPEKQKKGVLSLDNWYYVVSDKMERDLTVFKQKFPQMNWDTVIDETPKKLFVAGGRIQTEIH